MISRCTVITSSIMTLALGLSTIGVADDAEFQIEQQALDYSSTSTDSKATGGTSTKKKTDELKTMPNSMELMVNVDKVNYYLYPTDDEMSLGVGYYVMPALEVGFTLSLDSTKVDKPKLESVGNDYGLAATYYLGLGNHSVEIDLAFGLFSGKDDKTDTDPTTNVTTISKSTSSGTAYNVGVSYVCSISKNFAWLAGVGYVGGSLEDKSGSLKTKTTFSLLDVNLTTFRIKF